VYCIAGRAATPRCLFDSADSSLASIYGIAFPGVDYPGRTLQEVRAVDQAGDTDGPCGHYSKAGFKPHHERW